MFLIASSIALEFLAGISSAKDWVISGIDATLVAIRGITVKT